MAESRKEWLLYTVTTTSNVIILLYARISWYVMHIYYCSLSIPIVQTCTCIYYPVHVCIIVIIATMSCSQVTYYACLHVTYWLMTKLKEQQFLTLHHNFYEDKLCQPYRHTFCISSAQEHFSPIGMILMHTYSHINLLLFLYPPH